MLTISFNFKKLELPHEFNREQNAIYGHRSGIDQNYQRLID